MAESDPQTLGNAADPHAVAHRLSRLPDSEMRAAVLGDLVEAMSPEEAAWLLDSLATAGRGGGPPFDLGLHAAVGLTSSDRLGYDSRRAIYEAAERHGLQAARELLFSEQHEDSADAQPRPLTPGSRPLTLGERKSLARSWRRDVLERLVIDPHADVVALLLKNPHLTERDVLRIATARRSPAGVLILLAQSKRWSCRPAVRRALVRNPRLPVAMALRLVGLLNQSELRDIALDGHIAPELSVAVNRRLRRPS